MLLNYIEIFCKVVDNFGDAGVCWRLACELHRRSQAAVTLWIDQPQTLAAMMGEAAADAGVQVREWTAAFVPEAVGDLVIEAFACGLPGAQLQAMAARERAPVWVNLEYLSCEDWVAGCHGRASPHPSLPLTCHFFFPGFTENTGGLLREAGLLEAQAAFTQDARARYWQQWGETEDCVSVSLFSYEAPFLEDCLHAWAGGDERLRLAVPQGRVWASLARFCGGVLPAGTARDFGALRVLSLPFVTQTEYDRLLWACDANIVRGEDSWVRAHWAQRPFLWHAYVQEDQAHLAKLAAFHDWYGKGLTAEVRAAWQAASSAWNAGAFSLAHWQAWRAHWPQLREHAQARARMLAAESDLVSRLLAFAADVA